VSDLPPCRSCGSFRLQQFLSLGKTPLADNILAEAAIGSALEGREPHFPLDVAFCPDCTLVQILEEVPPDMLFVDNYLYFSSFSPALLDHSRRHALGLIKSLGLDHESFVIELASNDGYLLRNFVEHGVRVLGVDPAPDQAAAANAAGVQTMTEFFGMDVARRIRELHGPADVVIANNVMAHVPKLNDFVAGMAIVLADDGVVTVENPYVRDLVERCEFDTIYHEHFCYYSCTAVDRLARRHGMFLNHVEYFPWLHGGTLRWHLGKEEDVSPTAFEYLRCERELGLTAFGYYADFAARVEQLRTQLCSMLKRLRAEGARISGYGAAAKGSTLLNFCGLGTDMVEYVVDRNTYKQGKHMPGTHQPILPPETLVDDKPDYVLLLAWNFTDEIVRQQAEYRRSGGRFIRPIPIPEVL
jgi:SAM-dependent methyltransferase